MSVRVTQIYAEIAFSVPAGNTLNTAVINFTDRMVAANSFSETLVFENKLSLPLGFESEILFEDALEVSAVSGLAFSETWSVIDTLSADNVNTIAASEVIEFTDSLVRPTVLDDTVEETFELTDTLRVRDPVAIRMTNIYAEIAFSVPSPRIDLSEDLVFSSTLSSVALLNTPLSDTLVFTSELCVQQSFENELIWVDTLSVAPDQIFETLNFVEDIDGDLLRCSAVVEQVIFTEQVSATQVMYLETSEDISEEITERTIDTLGVTGTQTTAGLNVSLVASGEIDEELNERVVLNGTFQGVTVKPGPEDILEGTLTFNDRLNLSTIVRYDDTVIFTDSLAADTSQTLSEDLGFSDVLAACAVIQHSVNEVCEWVNTVTSVLEDSSCLFDDRQFPPYAPAVTTGLGDPGVFRLLYPAEGLVANELRLKSPNFQNRHDISPTRTINENRNGDLIVFIDPDSGPPVETQVFSFSSLKREKVLALEQWHEDFVGREIRIVDHEERLWRGIITVVDDASVQDGRMSFTTSFTFEGDLV